MGHHALGRSAGVRHHCGQNSRLDIGRRDGGLKLPPQSARPRLLTAASMTRKWQPKRQPFANWMSGPVMMCNRAKQQPEPFEQPPVKPKGKPGRPKLPPELRKKRKPRPRVLIDRRPEHGRRMVAINAGKLPTPSFSDPVFEQTLRTAVIDEYLLGMLLIDFRKLCREVLAARKLQERLLKDLAKRERKDAIYESWRRGETQKEIGDRLGLAKEQINLLLQQERKRRDGWEGSAGDRDVADGDKPLKAYEAGKASIQQRYKQEDADEAREGRLDQLGDFDMAAFLEAFPAESPHVKRSLDE